MAKINWPRAKTDYLKDETYSLSDIAAKYGVSATAVAERAAKEKWVELRKKTLGEVDKKLIESLPETIAQVNLRHVGVGKALQGIGLEAIKSGMKPQSYKDARLSILSGVQIERDALGLNEKEVKDEVYQKFSQFTFIFNLTDEELERFIRASAARAGWKIEPISGTVLQPADDGEKSTNVESA